jgi:pterin-4a-carbinolamine dehydratase
MYIENPQVKLDHFADIGFFYNEVILMVYTHDVNGLTQLDFKLALYIDEALRKMGAKEIG